MSVIDKQAALAIARKAKAEIGRKRPRSPHDLARIYYQGQRVASFQIRRGSKKSAGHDYIPDDLFVTPRFARLFAQCEKTLDDLIEHWRGIGLIQEDRAGSG